MLKPKKKLTKKEIQRDPFLESMDKAQSHFEHHRANYFKGVVGIIVLFIAFNVFSDKRSGRNDEANAALGKALVALEQGDTKNAQFQLESILSEYSGSKSAEIAGYHIGKIMYVSEDYKGAEIHLLQYLNDHTVDMLIPSTAIMLAGISERNGDTVAALSYFDTGMNWSKGKHDKRILNLEKAKLNYKQGNIENAKHIVGEILSEKDLTPVQKNIAEELLGKITG